MHCSVRNNMKNLNKAVIEIDEVEYLIDAYAAQLIENNSKEVPLIRLFDRKILILSATEIIDIIKKNGIIDRLD